MVRHRLRAKGPGEPGQLPHVLGAQVHMGPAVTLAHALELHARIRPLALAGQQRHELAVLAPGFRTDGCR
ncbi:hypothetical protein GCM10010503_06570 [Streptomyces lucensis JCM 4490]|uniref:Uncharacterized protein n=1 Tax=Streptomyces lucensis JCM 4490 TaxID=1306176 RepID=A0A918IXN7_9ACTN|nr:hypothetical protein GCM10010503_06570 [Streptomyces lucensis JCM 4490]